MAGGGGGGGGGGGVGGERLGGGGAAREPGVEGVPGLPEGGAGFARQFRRRPRGRGFSGPQQVRQRDPEGAQSADPQPFPPRDPLRQRGRPVENGDHDPSGVRSVPGRQPQLSPAPESVVFTVQVRRWLKVKSRWFLPNRGNPPEGYNGPGGSGPEVSVRAPRRASGRYGGATPRRNRPSAPGRSVRRGR